MIEPTQVESLLEEALPKSPSERAAYLDHACEGNRELRQEVERLLAVHPHAQGFLDRPALHDTAAHGRLREVSGAVIGPYKLVEPIGEGGMGTVWMAQQTEPVKRVVALKLIKAGMDSKQVIARFEAERQALALMDHANIARVLDAGTTSAGRPYFVMDLVKGVPITKYCDEHHLTPRQRLELFIPVCQAVQHAHQKGIIHRDLKPSNVLVALYDGKPVPKVIDFGVAKAAGQSLTDKTLVTGFGNIVGTLEYMSPEQAEINQLDIDTRSDIYSLGVLLYELLTGSPPFSREDLEKAGMLEMLRVIREQEPSKPSTKLSSSDALPTLSANRGTEPAKLTKLVRGELDWIVMKALEKDRSRRYETANGFAMDVQRYLADEPVQACPPSAGYRLRKFARRNKAKLAVAAIILFFLVLSGSIAGWAWRDRAARHAEQVNNLERAVDRAELLQQEGKRGEALAAFERVRLLARESEPLPPLRKRIDSLQGLLDAEEQDLDFVARFEAIRREDQSEVDPEKNVFSMEKGYPKLREALKKYGIEVAVTPPPDAVARTQGRPPELQKLVVAALDECLRFVPSKDVVSRPWFLEVLEKADGDPWRKEVRKAWRNASELERLVKDENVSRHPANFLVMTIVALPAKSPGRLDLARRVQRAYPDDFWANQRLGADLRESGKPMEAIHYETAALALQPRNPGAYLNRSLAFDATGNLAQALADINQAIDLAPRYAMAWRIKGRLLQSTKDMKNAEAALRQAVALVPKDPVAHYHLANVLLQQEQLDEAIAAYRKAIQLKPDDVHARMNLGTALEKDGKGMEALAEYREVIRLQPKDSATQDRLSKQLVRLGNSLKTQKHHAEAEVVFREFVRFQPNAAEGHANLGIVLQSQRKWEEARAALDRAVTIKPDYQWARSNLAWIQANCPDPRFHDFPRALEHAQKATELSPNYRLVWNHLGAIQYRAGMWQQALEALQKAEQMGSTPDNYHRIYLVMANWRLDKKHEALKHWVQFVPWMEGAAPSLGENHYEELCNLRAEAEGLLGKFRDPEAACLEILRVEPKSAWAHYGLADVFSRSRQWAKSAAAYVKALDLEEPIDLPAWLTCACSLVQAGDTEAYRKLCERMARRFGQSRDPHQIAFLAHVCVLAPHALADSDRVVQLAEQRLALTAKIDVHKLWSMHVLGLAYYRAGQFEKAVARLEAAQKDPGFQTSDFKMSNWLVLAMSRHRLGQDREAAAALQSARAMLAKEPRELAWQTLIVQILFREAESLLRKQ